jgi:tRNA (guanine37-N1)-methyltransferase
MAGSSRGIRVPRAQGEAVRKALVEMGLFDRRRKISSDGSFVYLPVLSLDGEPLLAIKKITDLEPVEAPFEAEKPIVAPESILGYKPSYEVVGDIAIVEPVKPEDAQREAEALLSAERHLRTILIQASDVEGEFRTRRFHHLAGEKRTSTIHKENGLRLKLDLEKVYFSPRLATERLRIAEQVHPGQTVLDMFAGVGPFALLMAKRGARVVTIDKNPYAVCYLLENVALNKIQGVEALEGDAALLAQRFEGHADHVIMNIPHSASGFLTPAMRVTMDGGIVHYYAFAPEDDLYRDRDIIEKAAYEFGVRVEVLYQGIVRSYAPRVYNVVLDFRVIKS